MTDKMREAFEKWYITNTFAHVDHLSVFYNDLNCYPTPIANHCWKAWQAAQSVSVPVVWEDYVISIAGAYESGIGHCNDNLRNPYKVGSAEAFAYDYGKEFGKARGIEESVPVVGEVVAYMLPDGEIRHSCECTAGSFEVVYGYPLIVQPTTSITAAEIEQLRKDAAKVINSEQIRIAAVAAVRAVTGCPDIKGKDGAYLVDEIIVRLLEMQNDAAVAAEGEKE